MARSSWRRDYCFWRGKRLSKAEWIYGACFECIERKAEEKGYTVHAWSDDGGWKYCDLAPRWVEYGDPMDVDDKGLLRFMRVVSKYIDFSDCGLFKDGIYKTRYGAVH